MFKYYYIFLSIILVTININITANAATPVVIEFFGKNNCKDDDKAQAFFQKTLRTEKDIILIDCRVRYDDSKNQKKENKKFSHKFCTKRLEKYKHIFKKKYRYSFPAILINGHIDANYNDVMPAVIFGRTDNIGTISLTLNGDSLNIIIPKIKSDIKSGELLLHIYNKTSSEKIEKPSKTKIQSLQPTIINQLYYRPVSSMQVIGKWNGEEMTLNYKLNNLNSLLSKNYKKLGYIVTLRENDSYGKIMAAGEIIPEEEIYSSLPYSKPIINIPQPKNQASQ